jgi:hypothetical protein
VARDRKSRAQALRMHLIAQGAYIQAQGKTESAKPGAPPPPQPVIGAKRARLAQDPVRQAGPGRPRGTQVAAAQPGQTTLLSSLASRVWRTPGESPALAVAPAQAVAQATAQAAAQATAQAVVATGEDDQDMSTEL